MPYGPEAVFSQKYLFFGFKASLQFDTFNGIAAHANEVMVMIVGPSFVSAPAVTEVQLPYDVSSLKEFYFAIDRGDVNPDIAPIKEIMNFRCGQGACAS
jgi:hypothetical protein